MNRIYHIILTLLLTSGFCVSQDLIAQRTITGIITDQATGESLIGANILIKGTTQGTITDFDGNYSLDIPSDEVILVISYTGYTTVEQTIEAGAANEFNIAMTSGELLDEVVVIGYGEVKREDLTGSIQSINEDAFNKGNVTSPQQLLAGKVAGVAITNDGAPGSGARIRIRGASSLSASNDPLIVIDGVPLDNEQISGGRNNLNIINPNDIESMTILKDASAAAIYGNRAAAGVIIITTKKGSIGKKLKVGYNTKLSSGKINQKVDILNADEFRDLVGTVINPDQDAEYLLLGDANTDWQDEVYQSAFGQDHNLNASGAFGEVPYRVSLGYTDMNGLLKTDNFKRATVGINVNPRLIDNRLQLNFGIKGSRSDNHFADNGAIGEANTFDPTQRVLDPGNEFGGYFTWTNANGDLIGLATTNPIARLNLKTDESTVYRYIANASADYRFGKIPALRANLNMAYDYSNGEGSIFIDSIASFAQQGTDNTYKQEKKNSLLEFYLNYKKDLTEDFNLDAMVGYSYQKFGLASENRDRNLTGTIDDSRSDASELILASVFGRLNLGFAERYLLTFTLRNDGTSRFAPETRWGVFPSAALGVKLLNNDNTYFNNLKLRLGWGVTGQQDIGKDNYYAYLGTYQSSLDGAAYQLGDEFIITQRPNGYDEEITWETTTTYNIGFDYSIIKDRLSGSLDLYQRNTDDLLNNIPVSAGSNLRNRLTTNIGSMTNQGIELALNGTPILTDKLSWDVGFNVAYNQNEITKLTSTDDPDYLGVETGGIAGGIGSNIQIHSVGYAPSSFFVYEQVYDENGQPIIGEFVDQNKDGIINEQDKYRYEKPDADYIFGLTSSFSYGDFDFSFAGRANVGNFIYNNVETNIGYLGRVKNITGSLQNVHRVAVEQNIQNQSDVTFSDHFVVPGDFFRLDHITVGYNFDDLPIGNYLRLYATLQNALVLTKYDGLDPEANGDNKFGIDDNLYPRPRTFVFGLNIDF